ncbi:cell division protein SepF [Amedibacillus sp. YH-ame10]
MKEATHKLFTSFYKDKSLQQTQDYIVCFFRFHSLEDCPCAYEALQKGFVVFLDLTGMQEGDILRLKDYMQGVCISLHAQVKEICEDYITYFPQSYHLQIFES